MSKNELEVDKKLQRIAIDVLDMIAGGADEQTVCEYFKVKRGTFVQWIIKYPQFESAVKEARKQRADSFKSIIQDRMYCDEITYDGPDDLEGTKTGKRIIRELHKDQVPGEKLIFDKLKWLAEMDNPEKYGTKVKHEGSNIMPVQIVVDTGISKQVTPNKVVEAEVVKPSKIDLL